MSLLIKHNAFDINDHIRTIPDYPKPGIQFRDVTSLWQNAQGFRRTVDALVSPYAGLRIDKVIGIEARGFVIGGAVAHQLSVGFVPARKKGKLPFHTVSQEYSLEYGTDELEIHTDAIEPDEQVLIVDDLIATGGTVQAAIDLVRRLKGNVVGCSFIIDLPDLGGSKKI
ncbi:MAG: adenine phosphoribosyltransferase, partial [Alphaproteobacteria bacterium]